MVVGTLSLVQKVKPVDAVDAVCSGHSECSGIVVYGGVSAVYCIQCIQWFDLFAPKTLSPPPYTTIPLHPLHTVSTGLTFLHQRQCPHHHIPLFHCIHCVLCTVSTVSTGLTLLYQRQCPTTIYHYSTASTAYCIHWFDLFCTKDNVLTTIYYYSTASTAYCVHCVLHPHYRVTFVSFLHNLIFFAVRLGSAQSLKKGLQKIWGTFWRVYDNEWPINQFVIRDVSFTYRKGK